MLSAILMQFVAVSPNELSAAITNSQRRIVDVFGLDRCTLWEIEEDRSHLVLTHCWQRPGFPEVPARFDAGTHLPWVHAEVLSHQIVRFASIDALPNQAEQDIAWFRKLGPVSNVTIPLSSEGRVFGALAFAMIRHERRWADSEVETFQLVAQIVAVALGKCRAEMRACALRTELLHNARVSLLGDIVGSLIHELSQPLSAVLGNGQALQRLLASRELSAEERATILDDIVRDSKRAGDVVRNLRSMLRKTPPERESCDLNTLASEVAAMLRSEMATHRTTLRLVLSEPGPQISVVRVEIQQLLVNLILNAAQAMEALPSVQRLIHLTIGSQPGLASITVRDHGPGVPAGTAPLSEPFRTTKPGGLGMGLAICVRIVESHRGSMACRNHPSGGALFEVTLPLE